MQKLARKALCPIMAAVAVFSHAAQAQQVYTPDQLGLTGQSLDLIKAFATAPASSPGIAFGSPVAFGASWGTVGVGIGGGTLPDQAPDDVDGSMGVTFGLGDAQKYVGFETSVNVISLKDSFGEDGNVNLKLHTALPGAAAFAVGVDNVGRWGAAKATSSSVYAVGTKIFSLNASQPLNPMPLAVNIGIGDGRFQDANDSGANVFGSVSLGFYRRISAILDWNGTALNVASSFVPFRTLPVSVTLGLTNVTERNNGDVEFAGGVGYSFRF